jgi:hypothetical protein
MSQSARPDSFVESDEARAARDEVKASLSRVEAGQRDALEDLRVALCTYVGVLGRLGLSRDDVLASVREIVREPASPGGAISLTPIVREALAELTLEWCRAEYARIAPA